MSESQGILRQIMDRGVAGGIDGESLSPAKVSNTLHHVPITGAAISPRPAEVLA